MANCLIGNGRERKGTMFLRSDEMNYGRAVLNSNCGLAWHQAREAEPKDYDMSKAPVRDLRQSTYKQLGTVSSTIPDTTYVDHFSEKLSESRQLRENTENKKTDHEIEKELGRSLHATVVMPEHSTAKYPEHYITTHQADYRAFSVTDSQLTELTEVLTKQRLAADKDAEAVNADAVKKCISQFSDAGNHRRIGWNTWQDESGIYSNSALKSASRHYTPTYTLMPGGVKP